MFRFTYLVIIALHLAYVKCLQTTRSFQSNIHLTGFITNKQPERYVSSDINKHSNAFDTSGIGNTKDGRRLPFALNMMKSRKMNDGTRNAPPSDNNVALFYRNSDEEDIMVTGVTVDGIQKELLEDQITLDEIALQQQRRDHQGVLTGQRKTSRDQQLPHMMYLPRHSSRNLKNTSILSFEMIIGRVAMVIAAFMFTIEITSGASFPDQVASMLS